MSAINNQRCKQFNSSNEKFLPAVVQETNSSHFMRGFKLTDCKLYIDII